MKELNISERKVLTLLEQNCRMSASKIAKKIRLSPEGVIKIIKRLEERKIIIKYKTKINYSVTGYKIYPVQIKLNRLNEEIIKEIKDKISKHKSCAWFTFCEGEYDLLLSFKIMNEKEKEDMEKLLSELAEHTLEKDVAIALSAFEISKTFTDEKTKRLFHTFDYRLDNVELTENDFRLIEMIRQSSRETILNLAKKMKETPRVLTSRMKRLEKKRVITGYKTKLNMASLGYQPCLALILMGKHNKEDYKKFVSYCKHAKGIHYFLNQVGKYDLELTFDVKDINEFYALVDNIRNKFPFIKKITTLISKETG